jgi:acetolactate synthase-1/2/3 large subunit
VSSVLDRSFCKASNCSTRPIPSKATEISTFALSHKQHQLSLERQPTNDAFRSSNLDYTFVGRSGSEIMHDLILSYGIKEICKFRQPTKLDFSKYTDSLSVGHPGTVAYGGGINAFESIYTSRQLKSIIPRHEQGAGHMAEGYARATGKPGVVGLAVVLFPGYTSKPL